MGGRATFARDGPGAPASAGMEHMAVRALLIVGFTALLAACGEKEEPACCAIEPRAKCESELMGAGLTRSEITVLMGSGDMVCPSDTLSETRIREIAKVWEAADACQASRGYDRLRALDAGLCPVRSMADAPALPPGVDAATATQCATGLIARHVQEAEAWLLLGAPEKVCPTDGISEARIRDIIGKDWGPAGCMQFTPAQMLHALDSGSCTKS